MTIKALWMVGVIYRYEERLLNLHEHCHLFNLNCPGLLDGAKNGLHVGEL